MSFDLMGTLSNTSLNKNEYITIFELLSNSIESFHLRKNVDEKINQLFINITLSEGDFKRHNDALFSIEFQDNGIGFNKKEWAAFCTPNTTNKRLFHCKGIGRIQFWHYFENVKIDSNYEEEKKKLNLKTNILDNYTNVDNLSQIKEIDQSENLSTTIILLNPKIYIKYAEFFQNLKGMILSMFLVKLVRLKDSNIDFCININNEITIKPEDVPIVFKNKAIEVFYRDIYTTDRIAKKENFNVDIYKIGKDKLKLSSKYAKGHSVFLCVKDIAVKNIINEFVNKNVVTADIDGFYFLIFVSDILINEKNGFLESKLDVTRYSFNIKKSIDDVENEFGFEEGSNEVIVENDIVESLEKLFEKEEIFIFDKKQKEEIMRELKENFCINSDVIKNSNIRIKYGEDPKTVASRIYKHFADNLVNTFDSVVNIKEEIEKIDVNPLNENWREEIENKAQNLARLNNKEYNLLTISELMERLCKEKLLEKAIKGELAYEKNDNNKDESIIHNLFFKQKSNSLIEKKHDLWMFNEEFNYFNYISSDKNLRSIVDPDTKDKIFDFNDEKYRKVFNELGLSETYGEKHRPDIALFHEGDSIVLIEFKAPEIKLQYHTSQLINYARIMANFMADKYKLIYKKYYLYLIGGDYGLLDDRFKINKLIDGRYFDNGEILDFNSNSKIASYYIELMKYDNLERLVKVKNDFFRKKLLGEDEVN